jgi:uncharacterized membrane protein YdjX (TVP38/TMEM64 family)
MIKLLIGIIIGAVVMYLIARNSPEHFGKIKKGVDTVVEKIKEKGSGEV